MSNLKSAAFKDAETVGDAAPRRVEPTGILHFTIGVSDLAASRAFYEQVLGCTYWRQNDTTVFMKAGGDYFVLSRSGYHQPPNKETDTLIHHAFIVAGEDFDAACADILVDRENPAFIIRGATQAQAAVDGLIARVHERVG